MFLTKRLYIVLAVLAVLMAAGYVVTWLYSVAVVLLWALLVLIVADIVLMWLQRKGITATRIVPDRFSNGDENKVELHVESNYPFPVWLTVIDEIPVVFQDRNINFRLSLKGKAAKTITYYLRPTQRGSYGFGLARIFTRTLIGFVERRYSLCEPKNVKVYPSFLMLTRYELLAANNRLNELGIKRIRRIGNNTEFEQIRDYITGDDYRTINWKATARRSQLMVNVYTAERSQRIYNVIDKGRVMQQASRGMTLLDYAINASLVLSYVAMNKDDKAGLVTFCDKAGTFLPASRRSGHLRHILDTLYNEQATFGESDFSELVNVVDRNITRRSLLVLYTNFADMTSMQRQLPFLKQLASRNRVLVVFFEDKELDDFIGHKPTTTEEYFQQTISRRFAAQKRLIVSTLRQHGILSLLTLPENLSVNIINKYLELKSRNLLG